MLRRPPSSGSRRCVEQTRLRLSAFAFSSLQFCLGSAPVCTLTPAARQGEAFCPIAELPQKLLSRASVEKSGGWLACMFAVPKLCPRRSLMQIQFWKNNFSTSFWDAFSEWEARPCEHFQVGSSFFASSSQTRGDRHDREQADLKRAVSRNIR